MNRILCIVSSLDTGGAETFLMKIFRKLPSEYKIDFVVSAQEGFYEEEVIALGGMIHRVPLRTKHPIKTFINIRNIVRKNGYHTVLKLCDSPIGYVDLLAAKWGGAKKICVRSCNASSDAGKLRELVNSLLRPLFNHITDVKIAPSYLAAEYTFGKRMADSGNVVFLHNAVDTDKFCYEPNERIKVRKELGVENEQLVVGHIGRFNKQKNHLFLLDVFAEIKRRREDAILILVGDGENRADIISKINHLNLKDSVILMGICSNVPELLSAMDVILFPSLYEGMPNVIIEAQATGLPCVLSDTITPEAKITDLLTYLPLEANTGEWAEAVLRDSEIERRDTREDFVKAGYNIEYLVSEFIEKVMKN